MRSLTSHHLEHVRERGADVDDIPTRRALNISALLALLQGTYESSGDDEGSISRGTKRVASPVVINGPKRLKIAGARDVSKGRHTQEPNTSVPVFQHSFQIKYTRTSISDKHSNIVDEETAEEFGWPEEEKALIHWLQEHSDCPSDIGTFNLGEVHLDRRGAYLSVSVPSGNVSNLLTLPNVDNDFDPDAHDIRSPSAKDPLVACTILRDTERAEMSASLRIVVPPEVAQPKEPDNLPFLVILDLDILLLVPAISTPLSYTKKTTASHVDDAQRRVLRYIFPPDENDSSPPRNVDIPLLYSMLGPAPPLDVPATDSNLQPHALEPVLLPFQRRSVAWMLSREGKRMLLDGDLVPSTSSSPRLPLFWQQVSLTDDETFFLNRLTGQLIQDKPEDDQTLGGILAEEPGLGKTLECIALILLNPAVERNPTTKRWNPESKIYVKEIKTTLIVTPQSLAQQWVDEFALHAPSVKVLVYDGWMKVNVPISERDLEIARLEKAKMAKRASARSKRKCDDNDGDVDIERDESTEEQDRMIDWCNYVNAFDVCITTYNVLQHDLGIARPPPDRPRRTIATYVNVDRSRSPLVMCEWHRVIMDEVQMVGGGKTAEMVSLIPRVSSFAVSGTPARSQVADLIHVFNFLRVQPFIDNQKLWSRLLKPGYINECISLFKKYAVRTMKASVKDELTIPKQSRFLVPIQLGRVERHVYDQTFESALLELGFDARGVAVSENWQVDTGLLRSWLRRLRGICTHPQVGQLQNQTDKISKPGVLKTIGEVLESMKDQNWRTLMDDRKLKVQALTALAQLQQQNESNLNRHQNALKTLIQAEKDASQLIGDIELVLQQHNAAGQILKEQAVTSGDAESSSSDTRKGKGLQDIQPADSRDGDDDGLPYTAAGEEYRIKKQALRQRIRECQIVMHKIQFLKGDVYHVLGERYSADESTAYATAEDLRRVLLKGTEEAAKRAMAQLLHDVDKGVTEDELYIKIPFCEEGGARSQELMDEANEKIDEVLNPQATLLWKWRTRLIGLLTQPLTSSEDDADGQEYARSLDTQGEAETYLQAYAALLADRREVMTSERTLLAVLDVKEKKARKTKASRKAAAALYDEDALMVAGDIELEPENQILHKELHEARKAILEDSDPSRAIRSVMIDLNNLAARITRKNDPEKMRAADGAKKLRELTSEQGRLMDKLNLDLARLRKAFNERISYFRQLQEISDTVAEVQWEGSVQSALANNDTECAELDVKINTGRARQRYLDHLASAQADGTLDEEEESCILCKCDFTRGYVTACAHVFCEMCMEEWLVRKEGKACPICRVMINRDQLQRFAVGQKKEDVVNSVKRLVNPEAIPRSRRRTEYTIIDDEVLESIQMMESHGSYGSKIERLVQHLLYIELTEPGAKSIVFSAWADSLHIIDHALKANGIICLRIDQTRGKENAAKKFRTDPSIQVLLLHGDRENAGLNVTCASRVFLVESVVHHAFEIQAIARIDRMGQTRPTEVYCYYAEDTVERNILDLAARQGLSLYTKDNSAGTLTATTVPVPGKKSIDAPSKKAQKGDFVFKTDDMLAIFFPHLFEEIEYLIPPDPPTVSQPHDSHRRGAGIEHTVEWSQRDVSQVNAEAGPSRLA